MIIYTREMVQITLTKNSEEIVHFCLLQLGCLPPCIAVVSYQLIKSSVMRK